MKDALNRKCGKIKNVVSSFSPCLSRLGGLICEPILTNEVSLEPESPGDGPSISCPIFSDQPFIFRRKWKEYGPTAIWGDIRGPIARSSLQSPREKEVGYRMLIIEIYRNLNERPWLEGGGWLTFAQVPTRGTSLNGRDYRTTELASCNILLSNIFNTNYVPVIFWCSSFLLYWIKYFG